MTKQSWRVTFRQFDPLVPMARKKTRVIEADNMLIYDSMVLWGDGEEFERKTDQIMFSTLEIAAIEQLPTRADEGGGPSPGANTRRYIPRQRALRDEYGHVDVTVPPGHPVPAVVTVLYPTNEPNRQLAVAYSLDPDEGPVENDWAVVTPGERAADAMAVTPQHHDPDDPGASPSDPDELPSANDRRP